MRKRCGVNDEAQTFLLASLALFALVNGVFSYFRLSVVSRGSIHSVTKHSGTQRFLFSNSSRTSDGVSSASDVISRPSLLNLVARRPEWEVYVDQSKSSLEKGGAATLDAFIGLAPATVTIKPAILPKTKLKGPVVRCIDLRNNRNSMDVANVDSVDKVYRILTRHMRAKDVSMKTCECLKWKYKANGHLESGKVALAIDAYDNALALNIAQQEGPILLMRSTAYLRRAAAHKDQLKSIVTSLAGMIPDDALLQLLYHEAARHPTLATSIFQRVMEDTNTQEKQFRKTQYRHGLYQYALLQAAQDSLRASQLLPGYATSWRRAAEILSELWKLKESTQYYERAIELDASLHAELNPVIVRLNKRQELLDNARAYGWTEDALRLALDVAG